MSQASSVGACANKRPAVSIDTENDEYWHSLIDEKDGGSFLGLTDRTMQAFRQRGGGPRYIVISARCIRYRRVDLRTWAEARMRRSTSDPGAEAA